MAESKYARIEREHRFVVCDLPAEISSRTDFLRIFDVYISGTRLRLRRVEDRNGHVVSLKFGQKFVPQIEKADSTMMTNVYLDEPEYQSLSTLPGRPLTKRRYSYELDGRHFSIDVFEGDLAGLILCETELGQMENLDVLPPFVKREVTYDPFFIGGSLVSTRQKTWRGNCAMNVANKASRPFMPGHGTLCFPQLRGARCNATPAKQSPGEFFYAA